MKYNEQVRQKAALVAFYRPIYSLENTMENKFESNERNGFIGKLYISLGAIRVCNFTTGDLRGIISRKKVYFTPF